MTLLTPTPLILNIEDNFLITNNTDPSRCPVDWTDSEGNNHRWDGTLDLVWVRRHYIIPPGGSRQVPFDIVRLYYGDPRSVVGEAGKFEDFDGRKGDIAPREKEVQRIAGIWGLYDQNLHMLPEFPQVSNVLITTIGTAEAPIAEIFTPAVDPRGEAIYGHQRVQEESYDIATLLSEARARENAMAARIANLEAALTRGGEPEADAIAKDGPSQ